MKPLLGAIVAGALVASVIDRAAGLDGATAPNGMAVLLTRVAALELCLLLAGLYATRPASQWRTQLRLEPGRGGLLTTFGGVLVSLLITGSAALASAAIGLVPTGFTERASTRLAAATPGQIALAIAVLGVLPGVCEEIFFRGFMQPELARRMPTRRALVLTCVTFAVLHLNPTQLLASLPLALWWGYLSDRTGSVRSAIVAHATCNIVATLAAMA